MTPGVFFDRERRAGWPTRNELTVSDTRQQSPGPSQEAVRGHKHFGKPLCAWRLHLAYLLPRRSSGVAMRRTSNTLLRRYNTIALVRRVHAIGGIVADDHSMV